jgi:hypothetical protein
MNYDQWITDFLNAIGADPNNAQNRSFMNAWITKESGQYPISYGWNPLNTTQSGPGSYGGGAQGNIQFFPSYQSGLAANVETITNGLYGDLLGALRSGSASTSVPYHGLSTWGTGSLAGMGGSQPPSASSTSSSGATSSTSSSGSGATSTPLRDPPWLKTIHDLPFGVGPATEQIVSTGVVVAIALALLSIGGLWLIMGNASTRTIAVNTTKAATKAASLAA